MGGEQSAEEIRKRFAVEQQHIRQYVGFVVEKTLIDEERVAAVSTALKDCGQKGLPRRPYSRIREPYSENELVTLMDGVYAATAELRSEMIAREIRATDETHLISMPTGLGVKHPELYSKWTKWFLDFVNADTTEDELEGFEAMATEEAKLEDEPGIPHESVVKVIADAANRAKSIVGKTRRSHLYRAQQLLRDLTISSRVVTPEAEINVLRQGFILLMTAFDAAIFDLMRVALRKRFFDLISVIGKTERDSVLLKDIGAAGSFEALCEQIIEEQLKKRYIRDLLFLLQSPLGVDCVANSSDEKHIHLIELVMRRNLHVHNRGFVDVKYLEHDPGKPPKYNLFGLKLGEVAEIDPEYWGRANSLCEKCVTLVSLWAGR